MTQQERGVVSAASDLFSFSSGSSFNFFAFNLDDDDDDRGVVMMMMLRK